ncbi:phage tail protein [Burkholderia cenocepacia]|uniref:phage tail protein n=1 Tax=Burkholderia cenocepacia TaxID=95486 RepID=UPI0028565B56|nr:phage tail protein [Burkholderia cenocepacia]MDR8049872.1 phage tail protein [Burkholderia cenocepacia]HEM7803765.1 tail fiber protein [Burkholderia cenocepacia]
MANLKEESRWEEGVYQFETSDPVQGGPDGVDNIPTKQLANRTRHLKDRADANDKRVDAIGKQVDSLGTDKLPIAGGTMKGVLKGKVGAITPNNANNAGFGFDGDPDTGMFSPRDGYLQIGAQGVSHLEVQGNNSFVGPAVASGWLALVSGGVERARFTPEGRVLLGTTADNGRDGLQVAYRAQFSGGVRSSGMDLDGASGGQYRATSANYGVMLRNDDRDCYFLQTKKGDPLGAWNDFRPILWNLESGFLKLDATGCGTYFGGSVEMNGDLTLRPAWGEGRLRCGATDGYFYANAENAGFYSATKGSFQYFYGNRTFRIDGAPVYHTGNLTPLDLNNGGTLKGALSLAAGARIFLSEGSPQFPSLVFSEYGSDTGLYHAADGAFGVTCDGKVTVRFTADKGTIFDRPVQVPTPAAGDRSNNAASTAFVVDAIASASIGQIIFEVRNSVRAGCLKLDGTLLKRADYPQLWAYAQASGALATEKDWAAGWWGCFSTGDGETTFRIPEFRGEGIRCADGGRGADAGRGVGSWQDSQNRSHAHGASAQAVGDHVHGAWTDSRGWHGHHGWTAGAGGHNHNNGEFSRLLRPPYNGSLTGSDQSGSGSEQAVGVGDSADIAWVGDHAHEFNTEGAGTHEHAVGIGGAGGHTHVVSVAADGGTEARMRNIAVLAMIRAY